MHSQADSSCMKNQSRDKCLYFRAINYVRKNSSVCLAQLQLILLIEFLSQLIWTYVNFPSFFQDLANKVKLQFFESFDLTRIFYRHLFVIVFPRFSRFRLLQICLTLKWSLHSHFLVFSSWRSRIGGSADSAQLGRSEDGRRDSVLVNWLTGPGTSFVTNKKFQFPRPKRFSPEFRQGLRSRYWDIIQNIFSFKKRNADDIGFCRHFLCFIL